jgi:hypothetical protein
MLTGVQKAGSFSVYDCNNQSSTVEQNSLLQPEPCCNMQKVHAIERDLYGEIVQSKKERLVQFTRCTLTQMTESAYCGFQSSAGLKRYEKFHNPIVEDPTECRLAAKTRKFKINGKEYPIEMNFRRGLDNNGNYEVGLFEVRGVPLHSQVVTAAYQVYARHELGKGQRPDCLHQAVGAPAGHHHGQDIGGPRGGHLLTSTPKTTALTCLSACTESASTATFTDGTAIVSRKDKNQVAGLELKETMVLCGRLLRQRT